MTTPDVSTLLVLTRETNAAEIRKHLSQFETVIPRGYQTALANRLGVAPKTINMHAKALGLRIETKFDRIPVQSNA